MLILQGTFTMQCGGLQFVFHSVSSQFVFVCFQEADEFCKVHKYDVSNRMHRHCYLY